MRNFQLWARAGVTAAIWALAGCMAPLQNDAGRSDDKLSMSDGHVDRGWDWSDSRPGSEGPRR